MAKIEPYPSTLSDKEWRLIHALIPASKLGRPPRYHPRTMLNAILYVVRSGCTWRMMPHNFPHWRLVYYYFAKWHALGVWERINQILVAKVRVQNSKKKRPRLRSSTARALKWLASPESVALMQAKRSWDESGTFWLIPLD